MQVSWQEYIRATPSVLGGKPVVTGTRLGVDVILAKLASGESVEQVLESYPHLSREAILACLAYATDAVRNDVFYAVG